MEFYFYRGNDTLPEQYFVIRVSFFTERGQFRRYRRRGSLLFSVFRKIERKSIGGVDRFDRTPVISVVRTGHTRHTPARRQLRPYGNAAKSRVDPLPRILTWRVNHPRWNSKSACFPKVYYGALRITRLPVFLRPPADPARAAASLATTPGAHARDTIIAPGCTRLASYLKVRRRAHRDLPICWRSAESSSRSRAGRAKRAGRESPAMNFLPRCRGQDKTDLRESTSSRFSRRFLSCSSIINLNLALFLDFVFRCVT